MIRVEDFFSEIRKDSQMSCIGLKKCRPPPPPLRAGGALNKKNGFTLIELMIVVGIIGILVSIAVPQYNQHQRKARQSEAKIALGAIYSLEKSFYSEYSAYIAAFDAIGFSSEGRRKFYFSALTADCVVGGMPTGYAGAATQPCISNLNSPYPYTYAYRTLGNCSLLVSGGYSADSQVFTAYEQGNLGTPYDDIWSINHIKSMNNCTIGY